MGHVRMMAAVQPFISGAISKTINMPSAATVEEIETIFRASWEMGLKAGGAVPRRMQEQPAAQLQARRGKEGPRGGARRGQLELFPELAEHGPKRRMLPKRRRGITVESRVGGHKVYLRTGEYEDGNLARFSLTCTRKDRPFAR